MNDLRHIAKVKQSVAEKFGVSTHELAGMRRNSRIHIPRLLAVYLSKRTSGASSEEIGKRFGGRDRTVIDMYCRAIDRWRLEDDTLAAVIAELEGSLGHLSN